MQKYVVLEKAVGQTPLECIEGWRAAAPPAYQNLPITYAGRLDPMASGKLLMLIGEECKHKDQYLALDKEYVFKVLFDVSSDTGDILGRINSSSRSFLELSDKKIRNVCKKLTGDIELPYPKFSSKTVQGKPLHTWTLEGHLNEIEIPTKQSRLHVVRLTELNTISLDDLYHTVTEKIESITPVTDQKKALGNDFRRPEIRASWKVFYEHYSRLSRGRSSGQKLVDQIPEDGPRDKYLTGVRPAKSFTIATFHCVCSSGTYMRTLAEVIACELGTTGLAYSIHRTKIGCYHPLPFGLGFWRPNYS